MRYQKIAALIVAAPFAFGLNTAARHPQQDAQGQATQEQSKPCGPGMMRSGQGMMGSDMMTSRMMSRHQELREVMNKLMDSMTAIENETDPAALKSKLAEHRALLDKMRNQVTQQGMMQSMMREMDGKALRVPLRPPVWK
jgi:hypothetical protein